MRWSCVLGLLIGLGGCYVGPPSSGDDNTGGAGSSCDGKEDCADCLACANAGPCAQLITSCLNSSPCAGIDQCVAICGADAACQDQCLINNPSGRATYEAAQDCRYCQACPSDCAGYRVCD